MSQSTPTASTFRDPLLKVLGIMSGLVAGTTVKADDAVTRVCAETGIDENAHGTDNSTGRPQVRVWVIQAFNRKLRKEGLAEAPLRGNWSLTDEGVKVASLLLGGTLPAPVVAPMPEDEFDALLDSVATSDPEPEAPVEPEPAPVLPAISEGGAGVAWSLGVQVNTYNADPYIRGLAVAQTKCFGRYSDRSDVCDGCSLSGSCKAETVTLMAAVAARLRQRDAVAKQRAEEAARRAAMPNPPPAPQTPPTNTADADLDIDDILAAIENDGSEQPKPTIPQHKVLPVPADSKCHACHGKIAQNDEGVWVTGEGMYHPACFNQKHGV